MANTLVILCPPLLALLLFTLWQLYRARYRRINNHVDAEEEKTDGRDPYRDIEPLHAFDWSKTEPMQIRTFKPKWHLTMALENCPLSEYLAIDKTYLDRIKIRQSIMDQHPIETYQSNPACEAAVFEMYVIFNFMYIGQRSLEKPELLRNWECS